MELEKNYISTYKNRAYRLNLENTDIDKYEAFQLLVAIELNVYHWEDVPPKIKKHILIKDLKDKGISLVDISKSIVYQVNYYNKSKLNLKDITNFLTYKDYVLNDIYSGILITNSECKICSELDTIIKKGKLNFKQFDYNYLYKKHLSDYNPISINKNIGKVDTRYYQNECKDLILQNKIKKEFKLELTCGAGKSFIILQIIESKLKLKKESKFIIFCNTIDLCKQTKKIFDNYKIKNIFVGDGNKYKPDFSVIICSYNSNRKIPREIVFDYLIIDEAHHLEEENVFFKQIRELKYKQILNFSATFKNKLNIDYQYSLRQAINDNYLSDYRLIFEIFDNENYNNGLVQIIKEKLISWTPMFIYFNTTKRAQTFNNLLRQYEIKSEIISGEHPSSFREKVRKDIEEQRIDILCLCGVYNEGISINSLKSVMFGDIRNSDINKIQISMRASRLNHNKMNYNIIYPLNNNQDFTKILNTYIKIDSELKNNIEKFSNAYVEMRNHFLNENHDLIYSEYCNDEIYNNLTNNLISNKEKKVVEFLYWLKINEDKIPKLGIKFKDGSDMGSFWYNIKSKLKINKQPYNQLKINNALTQNYKKYLEKKLSKAIQN